MGAAPQPLSCAAVGQIVDVTALNVSPEAKARLQELGLLPGTPVQLIRFAPLGGETFERLISSDRRVGLPDSLVVLTPEGGLLTRSEAVIHLLHRMGPPWRLVGFLLTWTPIHLRDWVYDQVARRRPAGRPCPRGFESSDPRFKP